MTKNYFLIFGPQGSGKGAQGLKICKKYNILQISTGDLFRDSIANNEALGLEAKTYMDKGFLVPDDLTIKLLRERLKQKDAQNGVLLDGFPRNLNQAKELSKILSFNAVINLTVSDEIIINRIQDRRICNKCKNISSVKKLNGETNCACGGTYVLRNDDADLNAVKRRLETFKNQTLPLLNLYKKQKFKGKSIVINVDASKTIKEVDDEIQAKLAEHLK